MSFKKKDINLKFIYGQDNTFDIIPIELDGYVPDISLLNFKGFIYRPFDEIERFYQEINFEDNIGLIPFNPELKFDYVYRYNVYVTYKNDEQNNNYVVQNGNIEFIYEFRIPNQSV